MQKVTILCVGKLKEKFYIDAAAEYVKRLSRFCKLELVELPEERLPEDPSPAQIEAALLKEAAAIRAKLPSGAALIALCVEGEPRSSEALARQIEEQHRERVSPFAFSKCGISEGAELEFCCRGNEHTGERCTVADDKHVCFQDEIWSLTALAKHLLETRNSVAGPQYFKYNGAWLNAIRRRLENRE